MIQITQKLQTKHSFHISKCICSLLLLCGMNRSPLDSSEGNMWPEVNSFLEPAGPSALRIPHFFNYPDTIFLLSCQVGMFAIFDSVLAACKNFDAGKHGGVVVDFKKTGCYYDKTVGDNWWSYYFLPLKYKGHGQRKVYDWYPDAKRIIEDQTSREEANALISKYFHIKEELQQKVNEYVAEHFDGHYVITVHFRGTDKISEAPRTKYEAVTEKVVELIREHPNESIKLFIATDEEQFLQYMLDTFGDLVCYNANVERSTDETPIHIQNLSPYESGKQALIDCLLLSRGNILIRTSSNLSRWSTYFNPDIPVFELSKRYEGES